MGKVHICREGRRERVVAGSDAQAVYTLLSGLCFHSGRYRSHDPVVELLSQQVSSVLFLYCGFFFFLLIFLFLFQSTFFFFFFFFFFQRGKLHKTTNAIISENFVSRENCLLQRIPALLFCRHTMKLCNILLPTPHPNPPAFLPAHSLKS